MSNHTPNTFQTPNIIVDQLMFLLTDSEFRVLMFMTRHILGWKDRVEDKRARIALSCFVNGFDMGTGSQYGGCGLSKTTVRNALESLVEYKIVRKVGEATNDGQEWELAFLSGGTTIDFEGLKARKKGKKKDNTKRTKAARKAKDEKQGGIVAQHPSGVLSDNMPSKQRDTVGQTEGGIVAQYGGGIVGQTESNPTKPNQTQAKAAKEESTSTKESSSTTDPDAAAVFQSIHQDLGMVIGAMDRDTVLDDLNTHGKDQVLQAIQEAKKHNPRTWKYVHTILVRWEKEGKPEAQPKPEKPMTQNEKDKARWDAEAEKLGPIPDGLASGRLKKTG